VVAGSQYRTYFRLDVRPAVPGDVRAFAENMAHTWAPARAFVLDVARSGPGLYVIEANCLNSAGFYAADVDAIVRAVSTMPAAPPP
jgi:ATP-grasp domain, R2K clade family 3